MPAFNVWGIVGNEGYAVPMVRVQPFDTTTKQLLGWNPTEGALDYLPMQVDAITGAITASGDLSFSGARTVRINGAQVLTTRRTGWAAPTGVATRTAFDPATVTLSQLAERVKALVDDLTAHGLIGATAP
jgi:hypothetical protein